MKKEIDVLLFEVADKLVRLISHEQRVTRLVKLQAGRPTALLRVCNSVTKSLKKYPDVLLAVYKLKTDNAAKSAEILYEVLKEFKNLHNSLLGLLPRPIEPVELRSFLRQAQKQLKLEYANSENDGFLIDDIDIVFATQSLMDQFFEDDPATAFEAQAERLLKYSTDVAPDNLIDRELSEFTANGIMTQPHTGRAGLVSLPLIDLHNPCRWPSLLHEFAHQSGETGKSNLFDRYKNHYGDEALNLHLKLFSEFINIDDLKHCEGYFDKWLIECFCDTYGISVVGYAGWYAQLHSFFFTEIDYLFTTKALIEYPPAWFRLRMQAALLKGRFEYEDSDIHARVVADLAEEQAIFEAIERMQRIGYPNERSDYILATLFQPILEFVRIQIYAKIQKKTDPIIFSDLEDLKLSLQRGEPIPVATAINAEANRRNTLSEILLIGYTVRNTSHRTAILDIFKKDVPSKVVFEEIQSLTDRFDESLKRSIQVAEWIELLQPVSGPLVPSLAQPANPPATSDSDEDTLERQLENETKQFRNALLVDFEIDALLRSGELRVIPLINQSIQLGSSSIDLRLGHNFEVFQTSIYGELDVCSASDAASEALNSTDVEIDYLDSISLAPGQFILAHTLEYLRLPNGIAAQIEGRSSFARLGIQIHMTAGFVDAGFAGSLTLEILNSGNMAVRLYPGMRIAQLRLFTVSSPQRPYGSGPSIKYRGLLSQNKTRQSFDQEVSLIRDAKPKKPESHR